MIIKPSFESNAGKRYGYEEKNDVTVQDFYVNKYKELIVSENALNVFQNHTLNNCVIEEL